MDPLEEQAEETELLKSIYPLTSSNRVFQGEVPRSPGSLHSNLVLLHLFPCIRLFHTNVKEEVGAERARGVWRGTLQEMK
jgi:hypothetical protein